MQELTAKIGLKIAMHSTSYDAFKTHKKIMGLVQA